MSYIIGAGVIFAIGLIIWWLFVIKAWYES